jgi:hypothetical protein
VAFVHDDEVEEVRAEFTVQPRPALVAGQRLVDGEVHLPALADHAVLDLVSGFGERGEGLVLRVVDEDVAVGQVQDFRPAVFAVAVPQGIRELPADLKSDDGFAGAGRHRQQGAPASFQHGLDGAVDGEFLIVAGALTAQMVGRREQPLGVRVRQAAAFLVARPQLVRRGEGVEEPLPALEVVELDDLRPVGGVGEFDPQDFGVVLRLLHPRSRRFADPLRLDNGEGEVAAVA